MDYGNTETPSMHGRLGSATLSQLAFLGEGNPNIPWEKPHWDNTGVKSREKKYLYMYTYIQTYIHAYMRTYTHTAKRNTPSENAPDGQMIQWP